MMVKPHCRFRMEGEVHDDIISRNLDLPVLHVFRVYQFDAVDLLHRRDQNRAGQTIKIATSDETHGNILPFCV